MRLSVDDFIALLSGSIAAWLERHAAARIEYLKAENRALRSRLAGRRIIFTDAERRTLACVYRGTTCSWLLGLTRWFILITPRGDQYIRNVLLSTFKTRTLKDIANLVVLKGGSSVVSRSQY